MSPAILIRHSVLGRRLSTISSSKEHHGRVGRKVDDLPGIELIGEDGDGTNAEVGVASGPRPEIVWLIVGIAVLGVGGAVSAVWGSGESMGPWPMSSIEEENANAAGSAGADGPVSMDVLATYDLTLPGATLEEDTSIEPRGLPVTVWANADALLSLAVRGRPGTQQAPSSTPSPGPCRPDTAVDWLPEAQGTMWVTVPSDEPTAQLCWSRSSGDFWMLRARWSHDVPPVADRVERLRSWALGIRTDGASGTAHRLEDQQMRRIGSDPGGLLRERARVWDYDDHEIVLSVIENSSATSLANLVETGRTLRLSVPGLGDVWATDTRAGWTVPSDGELWATLSVPPELATELEHILQQLDGPVAAPVR